LIRVDGAWFLYATQTKRDLHVWVSDDLAHWRREGPVWQPMPGAWNAAHQVWAPHVEATPDGYFMYYTADMKIGVARADSPTGPFVDVLDAPLVGGGHGGVGDGVYLYEKTGDEYDKTAAFLLDYQEYAIDAFVLARPGNQRLLYFSAYTPLSTIHAVPMKDWTALEDVAPAPVLAPDPATWEGVVCEGVFVLEHGGRFHLMYSGNGADTIDYGVGVAVADSPLGPFERYAENPILHASPAASFLGPGHHGIVEGASGDLLMFYHSKVSDAKGFDRRIRYAPVAFDGMGRIGLDVPQP
jgi:beta-xylosidase